MKKTIMFLAVFFLVCLLPGLPKADEFNRGVAYYLMNDLELAKRYFDAFFNANPQPAIKAGFNFLLENDKREAVLRFQDYLERNYRSTEALIGIALAVSDMKDSTAVENLGKAIRLSGSYSPAYLCLGFEYMKQRNYPAAEENLNRAVKLNNLPENIMHLAELYFRMGNPKKALELCQAAADANRGNYYLNCATAKALFYLKRFKDMEAYVQSALRVRPDSPEALLLQAKYFLGTGDLKKSRSIMKKVKFEYYNKDYSKTMAEVLVKLEDSGVERYLYEVFSQDPWDPQINRLFGLYFLNQEEANLQNWVTRSLIAGNPLSELKDDFPKTLRFNEFVWLPYFEVRKMAWLSQDVLVAAARIKSGDEEKLFVIDANSLKILKSFPYKGSIQDMFPSPVHDRLVFSTTAVENEKVYVYQLQQASRAFYLKPVIGYALKMSSIIAGFGNSGKTVFLTDSSLASLPYESPFSIEKQYGKRRPIFQRFSFPVYSYQFDADRFSEIRDPSQIRAVPIPEIWRYFLIADASAEHPQVRALIAKGEGLEITAPESVKIFFGTSPNHFVIYLSDVKNAFQALIYDQSKNKVYKMDETMFLGERGYAELILIDLNPLKEEIVLITKDKERNLIVFNYNSLLYKKVAGGAVKVMLNPLQDKLLLLREWKNHIYYRETELDVCSFSPFSRDRIKGRRDLAEIWDWQKKAPPVFSTFNGELVRMTEDFGFEYFGISPMGALHVFTQDQNRVALFVNGRLYLMKWPIF